MNALTTNASRQVQRFSGLKAFCPQQSGQPSKLVSITESTTTVLGKLLNGRYQVMQVLGAGGFSQTYLAKDIHKPSNPTCVVKHFKPASSDRSFLQTAQRLFQTEAEILEKLGHNNQIPQLLAYFEEEQNFYLIQEYIEGQSLSAKIQPGCCWSESQVIQLLQEVLALLVFIHTHGVIHRDIKPDNLIQRKRDNKLVLIDFGSVKQIRTQTVTPQGHHSATIPIGTQGYMAAEQGQGNPRPSSDLYALGVISVQALTGLIPTQFQLDPDTDEICWQQQARVSPDLASFISKLVSYHFKDRYQSALEALEALQPLTKPQPSNPSSYSSIQVEAPAQQLPTPSTLLSQLPLSEPSQLEAPAQQLSTPSTLLSQLPLSEPSQEAVFSINSSEQATDAKNRSWIWAGIGTGLASAVALSAGISTLADKPMQDISKPNSSEQNLSKSDNSLKNTPDKEARTLNNSNLSNPRIEKPPQTIDKPFTVSSPTNLNRARSAREQPPSFPRERQVIAATTNPPIEQPQPKLTRQQPSNFSKEKQVIAATANPSIEQHKITKTKDISTEKLNEIAAIAKLSMEKRKLNEASEVLLAKVKLLELITSAAKSSVEQHKPNKTSKDVSTKQPKVEVIATTNLSTEEQKEQIATPIAPPIPQQSERSPEREVLLARLQARLAANKSAQESETSPEVAEEPAKELEQVTLPSTEEQEESTATSVVPPIPQQSERSPEREVLLANLQAKLASSSVSAEELETSPEVAEESAEELETSPEVAEESAEEQEQVATPVAPPIPQQSERSPEREVLLARLQARLASSSVPAQEIETSPEVAEESAEELEQVAPPLEESAETQDFSEYLPETSQTSGVPISSESSPNSQLHSALPSDSKNTHSSVISPDGQFLVGISTNNTIKIWNMHTGEVLSTLKGHSSQVQSVAISSDGQTIVSVDADNTIKNWNLHTGELLNTHTDGLE
ncbi:MAG: protein kinase [Tatlockia sp.]|nr:protein kinase [Tatlockia sp.]